MLRVNNTKELFSQREYVQNIYLAIDEESNEKGSMKETVKKWWRINLIIIKIANYFIFTLNNKFSFFNFVNFKIKVVLVFVIIYVNMMRKKTS